jgi:hypothetical protein
MPVVAATAGLANVLAFGLGLPANCLQVNDLEVTDVDLKCVFIEKPITDLIKMRWTHRGNDGPLFHRLAIKLHRRILLCDFS